MKLFLSLVLLLGIPACTKRSTHYDELCRKFDSIGAETVFAGARRLVTEHYSASLFSNSHDRGINVHPVTNALARFGDAATVRANSVEITTAGLGSWRMGILIHLRDKGGTNEVLHYFTRNTGAEYGSRVIYPR